MDGSEMIGDGFIKSAASPHGEVSQPKINFRNAYLFFISDASLIVFSVNFLYSLQFNSISFMRLF
jgi:hypothetical protein